MSSKAKVSSKGKPLAGEVLDGVGWVIGQLVLPIPDYIFTKKKGGYTSKASLRSRKK